MSGQRSARRRPSARPTSGSDQGGITVVVALLVNAVVAVAKMAAGAITGSSAMISEGWHAVADTGNQGVLLVARHSATRPADEQHPLGHGRAGYFWALIAAVGVFTVGGLLSVWEGYRELADPTHATNFGLGYLVLSLALVLEAVSLWRAWRQLHREADELGRPLLQHVNMSSEPTTRAVFAEDGAAVVGNVVALVGLGLHQITGSSIPDGVASLLIGVLLGCVGVVLALRNKDFLVGEALPASVRKRIRALMEASDSVEAVTDLIVVFSAPRRATLLAHIHFSPDLRTAEVEHAIGALSSALIAEFPILERVELVPAHDDVERSSSSSV